MSKRTTINDLAKALSLSPTLISMVLNGKGDQNKISKATQKRVLLMAKKMGYTPNQSARALRTGRTNVIGLIVPDIANAFYSGLARRFEEQLQQQNYRIILGSTDEDEEKELRLIRLFTDQNVDGIIAASTLQDPAPYVEFASNGKSVVLFDRIFDTNAFPSVTVENRHGAIMAIEALLATGKKNIAFITHSPAHISPLKHRLDGFLEASKMHHLNGHGRIFEVKFEELESAFDSAIKEFFKSNPDTDSVLVANNNLAFKFMKVMRDNHQMKKVAIVAFDDHLAFDLASPSVTAVAQPLDEIASATVALTIQLLNKQTPEKMNVVLSVGLVKRESHQISS